MENRRLTVRRNRVSVGYEIREGRAKSDNGHGRIVPLGPATVERLQAHMVDQLEHRMAAAEAYEDGDWLIADELGRPVHPERLTKTFARLVKRAELPTTKLHGLRHFYAWALISAGRTPAQVAYLMGDEIGTVMTVYGGLFPQSERGAAEAVEDVVRGAGVNDHALTHADGQS